MRYCFYFLAVKYPGLAFPLSIFARVLSVTSGLNFVPLPRNEQFRQKLFVRPRYVQGTSKVRPRYVQGTSKVRPRYVQGTSKVRPVQPNSRIRQHHYTASLQLVLSLCDKMLCVETDVFFSGWNSCVALASHNFFQRWELQIPKLFSAEFLRPFGSKRTKFERGNSAEHGELIKNNL